MLVVRDMTPTLSLVLWSARRRRVLRHLYRQREPANMPSVNITTPHALGAEEATARLKSLFEKLKERHGDKVSNLEESWSDNKLDYSFSTYGFNIKGDIAVEPDQVKVNGNLPFAAMMFKGKIEQTVREEMEKLLA
jgi:hypothetical protein